MEKIEVISIDGGEVPEDLDDELDQLDVSTHYQDSIFHVSKDRTPQIHAWLVKEGMITADQARTWKDKVTCCMWGT